MTTKDEALRMALKKAFDLGKRYWSWADSEYSSHWKKADVAKEQFDQLIDDTIREVLAQPEQEPVAWITKNGKGWLRWHRPEDNEKNKDSIPLYTTPPHRKPLSDEQWQVMADTLHCCIARSQKDTIEAALGIKE